MKKKLFIFSKDQFDEIKGKYIFSVIYSDIAGNRYKQEYPLNLEYDDRNKRIKSIDLIGTQYLVD